MVNANSSVWFSRWNKCLITPQSLCNGTLIMVDFLSDLQDFGFIVCLFCLRRILDRYLLNYLFRCVNVPVRSIRITYVLGCERVLCPKITLK